MDERFEGTSRLRNQGVYLITGGLGGIGLEVAEYLAKVVSAKLILTSRSTFPGREEWEPWLKTHGVDDETSQKLRKLQAIEAHGGEVLVASADVADRRQMQEAIAHARDRFGPINGVVHSAGVVDYAGVIHRRTREMTDSTIASKVHGTILLNDLLRGVQLDFFVLSSSIATTLYHNRFGQVGYVAANSFLDAYAYQRSLRDGTFTATINWDDWQQVGMSVRAAKKFAETYDIQGPLFDPLDQFSPSEGVVLFQRILNNEHRRVLISTRDLKTRVKYDAFVVSPFLESATKAISSSPAHARPSVSSRYEAPRTEVEKTIAEIWQDLLGIEEVGIHDDFFELGGDSLRGTQVLTRLREAFRIEMSNNELFENPTIADIAEKMETIRWARDGAKGSSDVPESTQVEGVI